MGEAIDVEVERALAGDLPVELSVAEEEAVPEGIGELVRGPGLRAALKRVAAARVAAEARPEVPGDAVEVAAEGDWPSHLVDGVPVRLRPRLR